MNEKLKILRLTNFLSQKEMANVLDVSMPTYRDIENGESQSKPSFWLTVQKKFNLSDTEILEMMRDAATATNKK
jgi:DNA-binding XRE family transcriptional regulator